MKLINNIDARKRLNNKGFSLVELLISIAILVIIMVPLMGSFIRSMQMNKKSEKYQIQSNLAASVMEGIKSSTIKEIIDAFNSPKELFDIIPNDFDDIMRLDLINIDEYVESYFVDEQATCYFAIHEVAVGGTAYDVFIELDATSYQKTTIMNNYPMPEIINLDEKANGLLFSDGSSVNTSTLVDKDQMALNAFVQQGEAYAESTRLQSTEYLNYLNEYNKWLNACEEAAMKGDPPPAPTYSEPTLADLDLIKYTDENEIKKKVTKNMKVTINDTKIWYEIEYICDWWSPIKITHSIDQIEYASTVENVYLFYKQSIFHESHSPGDIFSADRIYIYNNETTNKVNFFVADQNNTLYNSIKIERPLDDSIAVYTDVTSYEAYAGSAQDLTVNSDLIKTYELNRIFDITINICKSESVQANRYKEVLYTLESTKER